MLVDFITDDIYTSSNLFFQKVLMTLLHLQGNLTNLQRSPKGAEDIQSRGTVPSHDSTGYASFDGSAAQNSQNKGIGQTR